VALRTRIGQTLRREDGTALIMALGMILALSILTMSVFQYTSANSRTAGTSDAKQRAYAAAEAGINNAVSVLSKSGNNTLDPCLLHPNVSPAGTTCASNAPFTDTYGRGSVSWWGIFDLSTQKWTITSTGSYPNPSSPSAPAIKHTIRGTVYVGPDQNDQSNTAVWNYMVASKTSNATTCDMTLGNSVIARQPLYVAGNLCIQNTASIQQPDPTDPVKLIVAGKLAITGSNGVGTVSTPITAAVVNGGCNTTGVTDATHACTTADHVYASTLTNGTETIVLPAADWSNAYTNAAPGPKHTCNTTAGTTGPTWDNDATLNVTTYPNGSVPTSFNLTPATSYTCEYRDGYGHLVGYLNWDATNKILDTKGTMYIDGSMYMSNGSVNLYKGAATIYLTGTFSLSGSGTKLCGYSAGATCDFNSWQPNGNLLIIVPYGNNGSGYSVSFANSVHWQGGFFAKNGIDLGNSSTDEGPMFGSTISMTNSAQIKSLPVITDLPIGAPLQPNVHVGPNRPVVDG
jgi:Tfp pilus assembly protein PilX